MSNEILVMSFLALLTGMTIGAYFAKRHEDDLVIMVVGILQIVVVVGNKISEPEGITPILIILLIIMIIIGALSNYNLVVENYRFKTQQRRREDDERNRPNKTLRNVCGSCKNGMPR